MKNITVPYGGGTLSAVLDESIPVQLIDLSAPVPPLTEDVVLQQALDHPIGTRPLERWLFRRTL